MYIEQVYKPWKTEKLLAFPENRLCGVLHDLVPFVQFKKGEKHPTFSKVAGWSLQLY